MALQPNDVEWMARHDALRYAIDNAHKAEDAEDVVKDASLFYAFLTGQPQTTTPLKASNRHGTDHRQA